MKIIDFIKKDKIKRFNSTIYYRGLEYYEQDFIEEIETAEDRIKATVSGNRKYHSVITLENNELYFYCDCPFDGNCKHSAAVYIAIKKMEVDEKNKTTSQEIINLINKLKEIKRELNSRLGNDKIITYYNFAPIRDVIRLTTILFRNNYKCENEEVYTLFFKIFDILITAEDNVNNISSKEMYRSMYDLFYKITKTSTGVEVFKTHILTCNLEKTIKAVLEIPDFIPSILYEDLLELYIIIFEYLHRAEIIIPNKKEIEKELINQILSAYLKLNMESEYEQFIEQQYKNIPDLETKYFQILYKQKQYQKIIMISESSDSLYIQSYIIYLAAKYQLSKDNNIKNDILKLIKANHTINEYKMIKQYFPIEVIISIKDDLISIYQEHNEYKCYLNVCKDTGLIEKAFEYCQSKGIDEIAENYKLFIGTYDLEMIMIYQDFFNKNLIEQENVKYSNRDYYISKIHHMLEMKHGKYYVYGILAKYLDKSQYSILRSEMLGIYHSLNFGGYNV